MNEETLDKIGELAEQLDNSLFMLKTSGRALSPQTHIQGLSSTMKDVRDELAAIYEENGGEEKLNLQA